ncbi:serine hydrolase domain-containing protein [Kribbella yunnanensis]|uniref:Serine hydrolase domain-containing protein n=1 Tax=Kribbella yunnanensis TaxID=190194 RepID=A0ABP4T8H4_9ACTN
MKLWGTIAVLLVALSACAGDGEPGAGETTGDWEFPEAATATLAPDKAAKLQAALDKIVADQALESGARGVTAAVVGHQWTWSGAAGKDAVGTPLRPTTAMGVASITKTFVAAEIMLLVKAGKVDLDAPLSTYVKHKLTANGATVRQHLSMTSGVPNYLPGDYSRMDQVIKAGPAKHWTPEQALGYDSAPVGAPGTFNYSNPSFQLLGLLIEKVTGKPLATVLRRDLATPAGLKHAAFQDGEKPQPPVAEDTNPVCGPPDGYLPCRAVASLSAANAGLAADAPTVALWGYQLYYGHVIPQELVDQMTPNMGQYGLGTMLFEHQFPPLLPSYGHRGQMPDHTSLLVVGSNVSVAILLADGNKNVDATMTQFLTAVQPLLT